MLATQEQFLISNEQRQSPQVIHRKPEAARRMIGKKCWARLGALTSTGGYQFGLEGMGKGEQACEHPQFSLPGAKGSTNGLHAG